MNVHVVHASRLGATREIAERIAATLRREGVPAVVEEAAEALDPDLEDPTEAWIVGSAVYGGHWLDEAASFVRRNRERLAARPVWLFSSGPIGRTATKSKAADPAEVEALQSAVHARGHRVFSGSFDRASVERSSLTGLMRFIAKRFIPEGDYRDWAAIDGWAKGIARELARRPARGA